MSSNWTLVGPRDAPTLLRELFHSVEHPDGCCYRLEVTDDTCFSARWLDLGKVVIAPDPVRDTDPVVDRLVSAAAHGAYAWEVRSFDDVLKDAAAFVSGGTAPVGKEAPLIQKHLRRALESVGHIAARCGLSFPVLDPDCLGLMPFRRPTTIVADTSAVLQGGLDFVARFLRPAGRLKIPAVVHMEVVNDSDGFMSARRAPSATATQKARTLFAHTKSQGAQRALLRLELHSDAEVERPLMGTDPLRGIVSLSSDAEDKALGITQLVRSYADRLIHDTARHQQELSSAGHCVYVMTCDQGLARMSLAEGIKPLYFQAIGAQHSFGRVLHGILAHPFPGEQGFHRVPLLCLVWECAVTFGAARIHTDHETSLEIAAMGSDVPWMPFHARDDLLWARCTGPLAGASATRAPSSEEGTSETATGALPRATTQQRPLVTYRVHPGPLLRLVTLLRNSREVSDADGAAALDCAQRTYRDYRSFLLAGGFVERHEASVSATDKFDELDNYIRGGDLKGAAGLIRSVDSVAQFFDCLRVGSYFSPHASAEAGFAERVYNAYAALAGCFTVGLKTANGLVGTPNNPLPSAFAVAAMRAFEVTKGGRGEPDVLVGDWLVELAEGDGVHPVVARDRLEEARVTGVLKRYFEGSSPATGLKSLKAYHLLSVAGETQVEIVDLYDGRFLLPGQGAVRIRVEAGE